MTASEGTLRLSGTANGSGCFGGDAGAAPFGGSVTRPLPRFSWSVVPACAVPSTLGGVEPDMRASNWALLSMSFQSRWPDFKPFQVSDPPTH